MTQHLRVSVCLCIAAGLSVAHLPVIGAGAQQHPNISIGGTDASSNAAGAQARWQDGERFSGLFVGGGTIESVTHGALLDGPSALLLTVVDPGAGAELQTYAWTPRVEQAMKGAEMTDASAAGDIARALLQEAAIRFEGMLHTERGESSHTPVARMFAPTPPPSRSDVRRGAGSTQSGLPAFNIDSRAGIVQAGWLEGNRRYGVLAHGRWQMTGPARLSSGSRGDWLVAFELDLRSGRLSLVQAVHRPAGIDAGHAVDGVSRPLDESASAWVQRALAWVDRF
jgi:hypothetical protein